MTVSPPSGGFEWAAPSQDSHHSYLLALGDALRPHGDPVTLQAVASRVLGEYLGAQRVAYFEIRGDDYCIERDYTDGVATIAGRRPVASFGALLLERYRNGRIAVGHDVANDATLSAEERAAYAQVEVGAYIGVPLIKNGVFVVGLGVHTRGARAWTMAEVALVVETAERTWAAVERTRAEAALARSEQHYRMLFDSIDQGLCTIELLFDAQERPIDYRFLQVNAAFERCTGLSNSVGRRMRELEPEHENFWFEVYGRIALTGEAQRFEHAAVALGRYYDVYAFRIDAPQDRRVAVLFNDITERKRSEANLAFLAELSRDLAHLDGIDAIVEALGGRIGAHLRVSRCAFAEILEAEEDVAVEQEWHQDGMPGIRGTYHLAEYLSQDARQRLHAGEPLAVGNSQTDPHVNAERLAALGIGSFICVPITRAGRWRFMLAVKQAEAREWRADEIKLMSEITARIWTRVEQAHAESALKVSDARQRALFSQMLGGVAETDLHGHFTSVNNRYCEILGYSREELLSMRMQDILYEQDRPANLERRERLVRFGEPFDIEKRYVRKDGSIVWVHNSVSRLSDGAGKALGIISVSLDITERKQQEEQVRRGTEMLDFLIHHSPTGFYIVDAEFRISHMNAESQARAFRNVSPAIGWPLDQAMRVLWPEPQATEIIGLFRRTLETGEPYVSDNFSSARADLGVVETYNWQLQRITMPDGRFAVVCFHYDTTRLREVEQELRDADQRKDEFLATLAHELRNPLAPIRNSLHILRLAGTEGGTAECVHEMLERQVSHMVRLVDDLMEVSRITRGKFELRQEVIDLAGVVHSAIETSRPLIEAEGHELTVALSPEPLVLQVDGMRLAQVLANLLNNAAKYTEAGGRIWLSARREGAQAVVSVRDNGMGISAAVLPKVFDLFVQGERSYNRSQGGLGIGLTLVRSIVVMHGGTVEAHSQGPGQGSEFVVRLPLWQGASALPPPPESESPAPVLAPRRILVVDDNRDSADSLEMVLQFLGADVQTVYDGPAALQALDSYRPSVVFLDIGMPGMNGYEVAERMREHPDREAITLIALTGWGQKEDLRRSREAGFDCHLVKPVDVDALQALLASLRQVARS